MKNGFIQFNDHDLAVSKEVERLKKLGYIVQREYEILLGGGQKRGYRIVVDIHAVRGIEETFIEVGTLNNHWGDRLSLLKKLRPKAKIVHITQWKNYGKHIVLEELPPIDMEKFREMGRTIR